VDTPAKKQIMNKFTDHPHYVYFHRRNSKDDQRVFYVGMGHNKQGENKRFSQSKVKTLKKRGAEWFKEYKAYGHKIHIMYDNLTRPEAERIETE
jgi:hypothetical protein